MNGVLYVVATPIGNLSDITMRALEVLKKVELVLAEDTRVTGKLLQSYNISKELIRYDQHSFRNEEKKLEILNMLMLGKDLAIVTDAGTPGISDPGNELIDYLLSVTDGELQIIPVPGPSSVTAALSVCGFNVSSYLFVGFLTKKKRSQVFSRMASASVPVVFFESPFRLLKTLSEVEEFFGSDKRIFVGRELTKMHESHYRGTIQEVKQQLSSQTVKGELVVVLEL